MLERQRNGRFDVDQLLLFRLDGRQMALQRALMTEILAAGNSSGEFAVEDVVFTAEMIQSATMKFVYPQLWSKLTYDKLER